MGRMRTIARRGFLIGSVAIAGGVAFGTYALRRPHDNPLAEGLAEGEATFSPWVKISAAGITLITPHADLGQGAASMQAALIAEEMDLAWGAFDTAFGPPAPAYYNTALGAEMVPFMSHDESLPANAMRGAAGAVVKLAGIMATGGSSSVPDSYDKLRRAGAVARETLKRAAAARHGVPVAGLATRDGAVILPGGEAVPYTALAADAARLDPVTDVTLRDPAEWRLIGRPMPRLDILPKTTGAQVYGIDLALDGMVHAAVRTNPRRGGTLEGFDARAARAMRGVRDVFEIPGGVAAVADNTWRAMRAVDAVVCDWGPAPYPAEMEGHWAEVAASFTDERLDSAWRDDGDAGAAVARGAAITAEYRAPYVAHQPLEPLNAVVRVTEAGAEIWTAHQLPRFVQERVAGIAGVEAGAVTFHNQYAGGSFGHRLEMEHIDHCARIAARMKGVPVKLTYSREEDFTHDFPRQIGMARGAGTVRDGRVEALDLRIATVSATASQTARLGQPAPPGADGQIVAGAWNLPYAIPHFRVRGYRVPELAPTSSWRSVGASTQGFFADCFLDELIHAAGADPMAERLRLMDRPRSRAVLEAVAEMSGWGGALPEGHGRGVAFVDSFGVPCAEVVEVSAGPGGIRLERVWVAADVGRVIDPVAFENQVQGAVVWGLGHAMNARITYADGKAEQTNYHAHAGMRMHQCPPIEVRGLEPGPPVRGIGEPPVPPAAPALANAIFAATGRRLREMPFDRFVDFA